MVYRKFGATDLQVSEVGFGAWAIGGNAMVGSTAIGWGRADDDISLAAIRKAMDCGINFFDTADFYGLGHSEKLLGKAIGTNKEMLIASKAGHRAIGGTIQLDYSKEHLLLSCEASLRRLKRDYIDYYQLHSARMQHFENDECVEAMELLQKQGKIRYWGLSLNTFYPEQEANFMMKEKIGAGFQLVYNIINQRASSLIERSGKEGYGIIARMPLQFGLLTGKFTTASNFAADDHRSFRFNPQILSAALTTLENRIWPLCEKYQVSKTSLALSFILNKPEVTTVIPGIRTPEHVIQNTSGIVVLTAEDEAMIAQSFTEEFAEIVNLMEKQG